MLGKAFQHGESKLSPPNLNQQQPRFTRWLAYGLLALYFLFMVATNHRLTVLDDEAVIVATAGNSVHYTLHTFLGGHGQHEHPPFSDILLHGWLQATGYALAWVRVFAILFYVAGVVTLAATARVLGGTRAYWAALLFATLWPFGYFYARIAGWYCFCFFAVSLLLYCYFRLLHQPARSLWIAFAALSVMLLWTNYYSIPILLLLAADLLLFRRTYLRTQRVPLLAAAAIMVASFLPLLPALLFDARMTVKPASVPFMVNAAKYGYTLFAILASVAVAPWYLLWSIPIACAGLVLLAVLLRDLLSARFTISFLLLLWGLAASNHLDLKRLLFLSPWLILAFAVRCSRASLRSTAAITSVSIIFLIGWLGIATGTHRATINFYEPWQQVAATTSSPANGPLATIVSDSPQYFYYLNYALGMEGPSIHSVYPGPALYRAHGANVFFDSLPEPLPSGKITFVQGISRPDMLSHMSATRQRLASACALVSSEKNTPDPAMVFKKFLGPSVTIIPYRVTVDTFQCP